MKTGAVIMTLFLVLMTFSPVVSARQTTELTQILTVNPDESMVWNSTFNMSDPASANLTNYEQTVQPFMNESGISGIFTGTFMPPMVWQVADNTSYDGFYFMQLVSFKPDWIMSGSSVSWWRMPVLNVTNWDRLFMMIYRIGNPGFLTLNASIPSIPNPASRPLKVYEQEYWAEKRNETWYEQNVTAWDRDFTHYWLKVDAPIYSDEHYLAIFYVETSTTVPGIRCQYAQTDVSDDQMFESYIYIDGSYETIEADLDISVIHQYGMGHTVSGWEASFYLEEIYYDDFEGADGTAADVYSSDITVSTGGASVCEIDSDKAYDGTSLLTDYDGSTGCQVDIDIADMRTWTRFELWVRADQTNTYLWMEWEEATILIIQVVMNNAGQFQYKYGNGAGGVNTVTSPYVTTEWYKIWLDIDIEKDKYRGWLDEDLLAGPNADSEGFDNFYNDRTVTNPLDVFHWGESSNAGKFWMDELSITYGPEKTLTFFSRTSEAVTNGDYVTFMMPFMKDIMNASNAQVTINNINKSWEETYWIAENGPTDFTIKSYLWSEGYDNQVFRINVTFQNQTNQIFIHDKYSDLDPWANTQYVEHKFNDWYPPPYTNYTAVFYYCHAVWFRPYHALQVTEGAWVNTIVDPVYYLDGRVVDIDDLQFKTTDHSDPLYIKVAAGLLEISLYLYKIDDFLLMDVLPDLDGETVEFYINGAIVALRSAADPIFILAGYFVEAVKWIANAASQLFFALMYSISLIVLIPAFFLACLATNGIKRFFVIMASHGFWAAIEYGANFFKNSTQLVYRAAWR